MIDSLEVVMLDKSGVVPGSIGNPIDKHDGNPWGAVIVFRHIGGEMSLDIGWAAHMAETYIWAIKPEVIIPPHEDWVRMSVEVNSIWRLTGGLSIGDKISAQACVSTGGIFLNSGLFTPSFNPGEHGLYFTAKMGSSLQEVTPFLERTYRDVYKAMATALEGLEVLPNGV